MSNCTSYTSIKSKVKLLYYVYSKARIINQLLPLFQLYMTYKLCHKDKLNNYVIYIII